MAVAAPVPVRQGSVAESSVAVGRGIRVGRIVADSVLVRQVSMSVMVGMGIKVGRIVAEPVTMMEG